MSLKNIWTIDEKKIEESKSELHESIFTIGNGFLGMRGNFIEGYSEGFPHKRGTFVNGFFETSPITYGEWGYGYPEEKEVMINNVDSNNMQLIVDGEEIKIGKTKILDHNRSLNMKEGLLRRKTTYETDSGKIFELKVSKIASLKKTNLLIYKISIKMIKGSAKIKIKTGLKITENGFEKIKDPRVESGEIGQILKTKNQKSSDDTLIKLFETDKSGLSIAVSEKISSPGFKIEENQHTSEFTLEEGKEKCFEKVTGYYFFPLEEKKDLFEYTENDFRKLSKIDFNEAKEIQSEYLEKFWRNASIKIDDDPQTNQGLNFNLFSLLQSVGKNGKTNICAKGLSGEGYSGHYFWDTEIYMLPFFLYTNPKIAKKLLEFRYHILPQARERAKELSFKNGALYPWRTISGKESSAYYPAGTAQFHINADICYAIKKYVEATDDYDFLKEYGAEVIFESARIWEQITFPDPLRKGNFCINCVTGPDEYTALVNNNYYTNLMASEHLKYALFVAKWLENYHNEIYKKISDKIKLEPEEVNKWIEISENIYLPERENGITPQDDSFLHKEKWNLEKTPEDKFPLLLHYHPLVIYRHQVCKQADVILAQFLQGDKFTIEQKRKDFQYYNKITTHDSSLSKSIFSIVGNEIGEKLLSYKFFFENIRTDLDDSHNNSKWGIHTASMGGSWLCIVFGFAGMRTEENGLSFKPDIPERWNKFSFKINYKRNILEIEINKETTKYELLKGNKIKFKHEDKKIVLDKRKSKVVVNNRS